MDEKVASEMVTMVTVIHFYTEVAVCCETAALTDELIKMGREIDKNNL